MTTPVPGAQSGTDPAQSGTGEEGASGTGNTGSTTDPAVASGNPPAATTPEAKYTEADLEAVRQRMMAADKRAGTFEAELRQLKDKDLPALEKLQRDFNDAVKERDELRQRTRDQQLENAFLKDNKYKWKNPTAALKLADLSKVDVLEDGTVTGLTAALDALAKSDDYLLDKSEEVVQQQTGSTGAPGTAGRQGQQGSDMKKMAARIPALRSRGLGNG